MANSFVQLPSEILLDPDITALDLRIYAICLDFGRKSRGFTQIGHQHLGRLVGKHPATIAISIKRLTELGYIKVERIGLNRNDRIRCQKTVQRETRTLCTDKIKKPTQPQVPHLVDKSTKEKYKEPPEILTPTEPKPTPYEPPQASSDPHQQAKPSKDISIHSGTSACIKTTEIILNQLRDDLAPRSFTTWFKDISVENETDNQIEILTPKGLYVADFIKSNYLAKLMDITGKDVVIVADTQSE